MVKMEKKAQRKNQKTNSENHEIILIVMLLLLLLLMQFVSQLHLTNNITIIAITISNITRQTLESTLRDFMLWFRAVSLHWLAGWLAD